MLSCTALFNLQCNPTTSLSYYRNRFANISLCYSICYILLNLHNIIRLSRTYLHIHTHTHIHMIIVLPVSSSFLGILDIPVLCLPTSAKAMHCRNTTFLHHRLLHVQKILRPLNNVTGRLPVGAKEQHLTPRRSSLTPTSYSFNKGINTPFHHYRHHLNYHYHCDCHCQYHCHYYFTIITIISINDIIIIITMNIITIITMAIMMIIISLL